MRISIASAMAETRGAMGGAVWARVLQQGRAACPLIAAAVLAVYGPALDHPFQYDDIHSIVDNPHLRTLAHSDDFFWRSDMFSADPKGGMYRPLVLVSYAINYAIDGYRVAGYRLFNLAVHLGSTLLLWGLVRRLTASAAAALAVGLLFALHPVAGEPVNYISSRSESLCALFVLAGLTCHAMFKQGGGSGARLGAVAAFAGAVLAKSVGLVLPLVLLLYDLTTSGRSWRWREQATYYLPYALVGGAYVIGVRQALQTALVDYPVRSLGIQIATQCKALVYYFKLLALPWGQSVEHQFALARGWGDLAVWSAAALVGSLGYGLWRGGKARPQIVFWVVWPALFLLPTVIVPLNVLVNEHRLYIPAMGWSAVVVGLLGTRRIRSGPILGIMIVLMGTLAVQRSQVWRTPTALWADALAKGPLMPRPYLYMGDQYKGEGRNEEALKSYDRALKVNPALLSGGDLLVIHNNTGAAYLALGRSEESMVAYRRALAIDPDYKPAREALEALEALGAAAWDPAAEARYQSGMRQLVAGHLERAIAQLRSGLAAQRHPKLYHGLALAYERSGDPVAAIASYRTILGLPNVPASLAAGARQRLAALAGEDDGGE